MFSLNLPNNPNILRSIIHTDQRMIFPLEDAVTLYWFLYEW